MIRPELANRARLGTSKPPPLALQDLPEIGIYSGAKDFLSTLHLVILAKEGRKVLPGALAARSGDDPRSFGLKVVGK